MDDELQAGTIESATTSADVRPEAQVHVFVELTVGGRAVDWRAATTNTLGTVTVNMIALHVPGAYRVNVYAEKRSRQALVRLPVDEIRRDRAAGLVTGVYVTGGDFQQGRLAA